MQYLAQIRKKLNLSLNDLSEYLKISRGHILRAQTGKRRLKGNELLFAANLKILVLNKDMDKSAPEYSAENEIAQWKENLAPRIIELEFQIGQRELELEKLILNYKQVCYSLPYYDHIQSHMLHLSQSQRNWLQKNREYQEKLLAANGLEAQHRMKLRIKLLKEELKFHREVVGESS